MNRYLIRASGLAGMLGAVLWALGDVLLVGGDAAREDYPLLLGTYADRIPFGVLHMMLPFDEARLAAGALIPNFAVPLYLAGSWHLWQGMKARAGALGAAAFALLFCGNAISPLGHAAFYYPGMVYKTIRSAPVAAHDALLDLGSTFNRMVLIAWLAAVVTVALGMALTTLAIALGRSAWPRWAALVINPFVPLLLAALAAIVLPDPVRGWIYAGVLNVGFFIVYATSTILLWNLGETAAFTTGHVAQRGFRAGR